MRWTLLLLASCAHPFGGPGDPAADAGCHFQAPSGQCCDGLGCASGVGDLTITVLDATTQQPVAGMVTFTSPVWMGPMPFACTMMVSPCPSWQMGPGGALGAGAPITITVSAPTYKPATVTVMLNGPTGCCGLGDPTLASVSVTH